MSTKAIREVIEAYRKTTIPIPERHPKVLAALEEVEAIEKACVTLYQYGVVNNEFGDEHETTPALDAAADHLMTIGLTSLGMERTP